MTACRGPLRGTVLPVTRHPPAGRCPLCASTYDRGRGCAASRGYDRNWQAYRVDYLRRYPTCCVPACGQPATDVDHIVALRDGGGRFDPANCRPMCRRHHSQRTITDQGANRGRGRVS